MELEVIALLVSLATVFSAYHAIVINPRDRRTDELRDRLRDTEMTITRLNTEMVALNELPMQINNQVKELVTAINELKISIAKMT